MIKNKKLIIFSVLAVGGLMATTVLSTWAGYKTREVIEAKKPVGKVETVKAVGKYYIPAGIALGITIISDVAVMRIGMAEIAALTGTISYMAMNRQKLEERVKEMVGDEKWNEIKRSLNEEAVADTMCGKDAPVNVQETGIGNQLFCFRCSFFDIWFRSNITDVKIMRDEFEYRWEHGESLNFVEDLLDRFGIKLKAETERIFKDWGWPNCEPNCCPGFDKESPIYIDFDVIEGLAPGYPEDTIVIDLATPPIKNYKHYVSHKKQIL